MDQSRSARCPFEKAEQFFERPEQLGIRQAGIAVPIEGDPESSECCVPKLIPVEPVRQHSRSPYSRSSRHIWSAICFCVARTLRRSAFNSDVASRLSRSLDENDIRRGGRGICDGSRHRGAALSEALPDIRICRTFDAMLELNCCWANDPDLARLSREGAADRRLAASF